MDTAMEDFDWAREYLERHHIHSLWETCVQEIVRQQPTEKNQIAKIIDDCVAAAEKRKEQPTKHVVFVVGLEGIEVNSICAEAAKQIDKCCVVNVDSKAASCIDDVVTLVNAAPHDNVIVAGFPQTTTDAVVFENAAFFAKSFVVLSYEGFADALHNSRTPTIPKGDIKKAIHNYVHKINPIFAYYHVNGRAFEAAVDSPKTSPLEIIRTAFR